MTQKGRIKSIRPFIVQIQTCDVTFASAHPWVQKRPGLSCFGKRDQSRRATTSITRGGHTGRLPGFVIDDAHLRLRGEQATG